MAIHDTPFDDCVTVRGLESTPIEHANTACEIDAIAGNHKCPIKRQMHVCVPEIRSVQLNSSTNITLKKSTCDVMKIGEPHLLKERPHFVCKVVTSCCSAHRRILRAILGAAIGAYIHYSTGPAMIGGFSSDGANSSRPLALILGTNEIASAVAVHLVTEGYSAVLSHDPFPPVIRRAMAFHDALFGDRAAVEGIEGERAETAVEIVSTLAKAGSVAVTPLSLADVIAIAPPRLLIDARMQKRRVTPDHRGMAAVTVGLGPNFAAGVNCDIAIETRPVRIGTIVREGWTDEADGVSRPLGGFGGERFVYSHRDGIWRTPVDIGMRTFKGFVVGHLDGVAVQAPIDGFLRGVVRDSTVVAAGVKLLEVDARGRNASWTGIDERGRAIAEATVTALGQHAERCLAKDDAINPPAI
jgi:xanthine dehydrogenase accessory factor